MTTTTILSSLLKELKDRERLLAEWELITRHLEEQLSMPGLPGEINARLREALAQATQYLYLQRRAQEQTELQIISLVRTA